MSFSAQSYQSSRRSVSRSFDAEPPRSLAYAASMHGGAGGRGTKISTSTWFGSSGAQTSANQGFTIGNEKQTMQHLNDRLASYLEKVHSLEQSNTKLEVKIREVLEKSSPIGKDYSHYDAIINDLRQKILDKVSENAALTIQADNAHLALEDFRIKFESEARMRQTVEADIAGLRKLLDDTNIIRMGLESDIESLKEELILLKKNHEEHVLELRGQITQAGVQVDVDAPKGQDLAKIMEEMRAKYERIALKNQEEVKAWHESKITEVTVQVTENTAALKEATAKVNESRRTFQNLEIQLQAELSHNASLEGNLQNKKLYYNKEIEKFNFIIVQLEAELTQLRADIQSKRQEYEALLNIKVKLDAEIATYRRLLEGEHIQVKEPVVQTQTKVVTVTQTLVNGKVVSEKTNITK